MEQKPISEARLNANRENAKLSSGPTSAAGKAVSRLNAVKCNLSGNYLVFATEEEAGRYHLHVDSYEKLYRPVGPEESALVQSIADIRWRLNRIPGLEAALLATARVEVFAEQPHLAIPESEAALENMIRLKLEKPLRNLNLQENRLARRRERETAELEKLQTTRKANEEQALAEAAKAVELGLHDNIEKIEIPGVGFVFSKDRFYRFYARLTTAQKQKLLADALAERSNEPQIKEAAA